jgi:enoyl-CoA hydratase
MKELDYVWQDRCATVTLNRADKKNAMTRSMWSLLATFIQRAIAERARVLIIRANGSAFCAGADIQELQANIKDQAWLRANHDQLQSAIDQLYRAPMASIAVIEGVCLGGGVGIASACDFRLATHQSSFALTPAKLGLSYSLADTLRLTRLVGSARVRDLLMGGSTWSAAQAITFGFLHELHAPNTLEDALQKRVQSILTGSADAHQRIKQTLLAIEDGQFIENDASRARFCSAFDSADFNEGASAFLEKRPPQF